MPAAAVVLAAAASIAPAVIKTLICPRIPPLLNSLTALLSQLEPLGSQAIPDVTGVHLARDSLAADTRPPTPDARLSEGRRHVPCPGDIRARSWPSAPVRGTCTVSRAWIPTSCPPRSSQASRRCWPSPAARWCRCSLPSRRVDAVGVFGADGRRAGRRDGDRPTDRPTGTPSGPARNTPTTRSCGGTAP